MNFTIENSTDIRYVAIVIATNINGPFSDIPLLNKELTSNNIKKGIILFDLLVSHGKGYNRFATMTFNGNKLNMKSFKVEKVSEEIKIYCAEFYKNHFDLNQKTILNLEDTVKFLQIYQTEKVG